MAAVNKLWAPDRQDVIWIKFSPQVGSEVRDEHPMLVLSNRLFNERTGLVIGLPMSHSESNETNPFAIKYVGPKREVGYILTHQPKSLDWRHRGARPHLWKQLAPALFEEACEGLNSIIRVCV